MYEGNGEERQTPARVLGVGLVVLLEWGYWRLGCSQLGLGAVGSGCRAVGRRKVGDGSNGSGAIGFDLCRGWRESEVGLIDGRNVVGGLGLYGSWVEEGQDPASSRLQWGRKV